MKQLIVITAVCLSLSLQGQSIEKYSIDSGGSNAAAGNIQVLYTIGEVAVQEASVGNIILSEGFISSTSTTLSYNDDKLLNKFLLYPNPTYSTVNIDLGEKYQNIILDIYDIMGKQVHNTSYSNKKAITLNTEHLKPGLYLVKLHSENSHTVLKLVIK